MSLKTFIIQEELRNEHAERFIRYKDHYNTQVLLDLKQALEKEWTRVVGAFSRAHKINPEDLELAMLQNPKVTGMLSVEDKGEKLVSSRHRENVEVSPSIKIPLLYSREERDLMIKNALDSAETAIKATADKWKEIFRVEKQGRATPWFKIVRDHDEVRFQLALTSGTNEMYKTLYAVRVEYGKPGSKTKDFDRVFLISLT
jgi:hypothetical protein